MVETPLQKNLEIILSTPFRDTVHILRCYYKIEHCIQVGNATKSKNISYKTTRIKRVAFTTNQVASANKTTLNSPFCSRPVKKILY